MTDYDFNFKDIVAFAQDVVIVTKAHPIDEPGPEIVYVNKAFTDLTGYTREEAIGNNPRVLQSHGTDEKDIKKIRHGLERQEHVRVTIKNYSKTGEEYWLDLSIHPLKNSQGIVTHFVAIERDVTQQKNIEKRLKVLSSTDPLTGLLNRRAFGRILKNEFPRFLRGGDAYVLLMIDIDEFKVINDTYGHSAGDSAIKVIAEVFESNLRSYDKMARLGGDEFGVFLPNTSIEEAYTIAEKLRQLVSKTMVETKRGNFSLEVSLGMAEVDSSDTHHKTIMKKADRSMYKAKEGGGDRVSK